MEIQPTRSTPPSAPQPPAIVRKERGEEAPADSFRGATGERIWKEMAKLPASRPDAVERARQLLAGGSYPDQKTIEGAARRLAETFMSEEGE